MKRLIDYHLQAWKNDHRRTPLLLRGARQVGKTFSVRNLGTSFSDFVEINFELHNAAFIFEKDLQPERILRELSLMARKPITPGTTLLFLDEIQVQPKAIQALRYFYEMLPALHVIAAGSLLDFALSQVEVPVGRVQALYMYPLSFIEFLAATGERLLVEEIFSSDITQEINLVAHNQLLELLGHYAVLGGMPSIVQTWKETKNPFECSKKQDMILDFYRQDFGKYAREKQIKYVELVFDHIPIQLSKKFKYSLIEGDYRKRELAPALDLLVTAGIAHKVFYSAGQGIPLAAQIDPQDYKTIFLDIGLCQSSLSLDTSGWFLQPLVQFVNKGSLIEAFVGQEMLAYASPYRKKQLFYWHKETRTDQSEIDYLIQLQDSVIPVEVKSGAGTTLKSLHAFLQTHSDSPYGIRLCTQHYSDYQGIKTYPLYAIAQIIGLQNTELKKSLNTIL